MKMLKTMLIAVFVGIVCIETGLFDLKSVSLSQIILSDTFNGVDFFPQYISMFTLQYMPLFFFQIFFATYIYKHFCSASVYFFSRNINRKKWFLGEVLKIYVNAVVYLVIICLTQTIVIKLFTKCTIDKDSIVIVLYYVLIYSLYLLVTTLAINIISIFFTGSVGFVSVQSIILLSISVFFVLGNYIKDNLITDKILVIIKGNIIANLIFPFHSSNIKKISDLINIKNIDFDLNFSIVYFFILSICIVVIGCVVVEKHEFITNSKEVG